MGCGGASAASRSVPQAGPGEEGRGEEGRGGAGQEGRRGAEEQGGRGAEELEDGSSAPLLLCSPARTATPRPSLLFGRRKGGD